MCLFAYINKTNRFVFKQGHIPIKFSGNDSVRVGDNNFYLNHPLAPPPPLLLDVETCKKKNQRAKGPKIAVNTVVFTCICDRLVNCGGGVVVRGYMYITPIYPPSTKPSLFSP